VTLVKICGVCDADAARTAAAAGADLLGFHFCPSLRRVEPEAVRRILEGLHPRPLAVGVFIDEEPGRMEEIADLCGLDLLQLHGSEQPAPDGYPRPVIKALKVHEGRLPDASAWPDPIMLDSWSPDQRGGTGRRWDWELARPLLAGRRVMVAGGLGPDNVGSLVRALRPYGVDVSSGVESEPRRKDPELVRAFLRAVREADIEQAADGDER